ncbi:hypothetical protein A2U01_0112610, partial [Trifolium medium]|nr:hypothetical protein [Trifolium medium]
VDLSLEVKS